MSLLSRTPTTLKYVSLICFATGIAYQIRTSYIKKKYVPNPATVVSHDAEIKLLEKIPAIEYQYEYNQQKYRSRAYAQTEIFAENEEDFYERFPVGHKMQIYLNPSRPQASVLRRDLKLFSGDALFMYCSAISLFISSRGFATKNYNLIIAGLLGTPIGLHMPYAIMARNPERRRYVDQFLGRTDNGKINDDNNMN